MSMRHSLSDILPSDDDIITAIRYHFNAMAKDSTGEYVQFLESNVVHKAWSLLSNEVKYIQLDDKGSIFLHQCNGYDVEKKSVITCSFQCQSMYHYAMIVVQRNEMLIEGIQELWSIMKST